MCLRTNYTFTCAHNLILTTQRCPSQLHPRKPPIPCQWFNIQEEAISGLCPGCIVIAKAAEAEAAASSLHTTTQTEIPPLPTTNYSIPVTTDHIAEAHALSARHAAELHHLSTQQAAELQRLAMQHASAHAHPAPSLPLSPPSPPRQQQQPPSLSLPLPLPPPPTPTDSLHLHPTAPTPSPYEQEILARANARAAQEQRWRTFGRPLVWPLERIWWSWEHQAGAGVRVVEESVAQYVGRFGGVVPAWAVPRREVGRWWDGREKGRERLEEKVRVDFLARWGRVKEGVVEKGRGGDGSFFEGGEVGGGVVLEGGEEAGTEDVGGTDGVGEVGVQESGNLTGLGLGSLSLGVEEVGGKVGNSGTSDGAVDGGSHEKSVKKRLVNKRLSGEYAKDAECTEQKPGKKKTVWMRLRTG
ncbi:hypothetical protein EV356DRAFT_535658 [Viridothelium virens]|uniref:Uncharacterized protein n=1 Tax=Viridothelium virens TaxID=1048519 RepID=A0A6A6H0Y6_VIRVR|nr:hypothetical protein EV356DRAFT_535658 [Viridothelium virens]